MNQEMINKLKQGLLDQQKHLEQELSGIANKDSVIEDNYESKFPDFGNDDDENANEVAEYSDRLSIEHTLEKELRDVKKALKNIADGNYGVCQHCKEDIELERLKVRPTSSSCVACKKKLKGEE